jgi:quinol monooxygenase YgiN
MLVVIAKIKAKAGKERELAEVLGKFPAPTRREAGCIQYDLHVDRDDPSSFVFYERWADEAALAAHLKTPHITAGFAAMDALIDGPAVIGKYNLVK